MPTTEFWPVTLFGVTFTEADFDGNAYVNGLPKALHYMVMHAAALYVGTSATALTISGGGKSLITQPGKPWLPGSPLRVSSVANPTAAWMDGVVTGYNGDTGALDFTVLGSAGGGSFASWNINAGGGGYAISGSLGIAQGGTGGATAGAARTNLGLGSSAVINAADPAALTSQPNLVVTLDNQGKYPPFDGSRITSIAANSVGGLDLANINYRDQRNRARIPGAALATGAQVGQLELMNSGTGAAAVAFIREGAYSAHFGLDVDNAFSTQGLSAGAGGYTPLKAGNVKSYGIFQIGDTGSSFGPANGTFGSADVIGSKGTYAGFRFVDVDRHLSVKQDIQGVFTGAGAAQWYFQNGTLTVGSVPVARIPDLATATVGFANTAGSAPANGGTANQATFATGNTSSSIDARLAAIETFGFNNNGGTLSFFLGGVRRSISPSALF
jgi:hypothetical protein